MIHPDLLVGTVALGISVFAIGSALFNWEPAYELRTPRWMESRWGRGRTRIVLGVIGMVLFFIGGYLIYGLIPRSEAVKKFGEQGRNFPCKPACDVGQVLSEAV